MAVGQLEQICSPKSELQSWPQRDSFSFLFPRPGKIFSLISCRSPARSLLIKGFDTLRFRSHHKVYSDSSSIPIHYHPLLVQQDIVYLFLYEHLCLGTCLPSFLRRLGVLGCLDRCQRSLRQAKRLFDVELPHHSVTWWRCKLKSCTFPAILVDFLATKIAKRL